MTTEEVFKELYDKHKIEEFIESCYDYSDGEYADGWNAARDYILAFINKL